MGKAVATSCEVYFVQAKILKLIKIGRADNARSRFSTLKVGSPDRLELLGAMVCDEGGALERRLHRRFARSRAHGEWFYPSEALLAYIAEHAKEPRPSGSTFKRDDWAEHEERHYGHRL